MRSLPVGAPSSSSEHSYESTQREKVLEHLFIGDLLRSMWGQGMRDIEVLRAEVDRGGYDVVFERGQIVRHVQLKASKLDAKTRSVSINTNLQKKPSGCVIWLWFDPSTMQFKKFLWFGDAPGKPLPTLCTRIGRHSKGDSTGYKAPRPNIRVLETRRFKRLNTIEEVATHLFA